MAISFEVAIFISADFASTLVSPLIFHTFALSKH